MRYVPLYVHSFVLCAPRKILEAAQFNQRYRIYKEINNVPDRLRWWRHSKGLMQRDVAKLVGISRNMYMDIECGIKKQIPNEIVKKLADFYGVPMEAFMDDYNRFLADGQADRIRKYREATGLNKKAFAREKGIPIRCLQEWESGRKKISHGSWERYFKGKA